MLWHQETENDKSGPYEAHYFLISVAQTATFGTYSGVKEYQWKRIEKNNQPIRIHCGMLGKEEHKSDEASCQSL
jgi:hypothetical protein